MHRCPRKSDLKMNSNVGLAIQSVGIALLAVLSLSMGGSIKSPSLKWWTSAWIALAVALVSLFAGFHLAPEQKQFYSLYFFGEYAFGLMFICGCRYHATGVRPTRRGALMLIPAVVVAVVLPYLSADFNDLFTVQAAIMAVLFATSFLVLLPALRRPEASHGLRVMGAALILLTIDFLHYVPFFAALTLLCGSTVP